MWGDNPEEASSGVRESEGEERATYVQERRYDDVEVAARTAKTEECPAGSW